MGRQEEMKEGRERWKKTGREAGKREGWLVWEINVFSKRLQ